MTSSAALIAAWLLAGVGGAVAAAMLTATIRRQLKARAETQRSLAMTDGLTEALRTLVTGLRAGAHPATAAESAAADAHPGTAATMHAVAMAARLDGDLTAVVDTARSPDVRATLSRLATAWQLAQRHGLPLADVLDAVRRDLEQRARFTRHVLARMAGPRSSALALSLLPALGLALGTAMGANPLAMLTDTVPGQALLVAGVALMCAGIAWSTRITTRAVPR
ncbi:type II secretion system F family protein [Actinophytocola oryzae]|nr:type II secretion system F family protein [Actinophytocola oryzae]